MTFNYEFVLFLRSLRARLRPLIPGEHRFFKDFSRCSVCCYLFRLLSFVSSKIGFARVNLSSFERLLFRGDERLCAGPASRAGRDREQE